MQVTIYLRQTIIEGTGHGCGRRPQETYREALLVWAARHGFLPGIAVRLGITEAEALGQVNRIHLREEKQRRRVLSVAEGIAKGVVRLEGEARVVMVWDATPPEKAPLAADPRLPAPCVASAPPPPRGLAAEPLDLGFPEEPAPAAVEAHP